MAYSEDQFDQQASLLDPTNTFIDPPDSALFLPNIDEDTIVGLFGGTPPGADGRTSFLTADPKTGAAYPGGELDLINASLKLDWDALNGTITSYTGLASADSQQILDGDFDVRPNAEGTMDIARGGTEIAFASDTRLLSQELRYASNFDGPVQFTIGALYWEEDKNQDETAVSALNFPFGPTGADPGYFNLVAAEATRMVNRVERDITSTSAYGLIEWNITGAWKLTLEGRYAREEMEVLGTGCDPDQPAADFRCPFFVV